MNRPTSLKTARVNRALKNFAQSLASKIVMRIFSITILSFIIAIATYLIENAIINYRVDGLISFQVTYLLICQLAILVIFVKMIWKQMDFT